MDQRQESGRRYTIFVGSTAAIERIRSGSIGPDQRYAVAAIEVCTRLRLRDNKVVIRWVPAHQGVLGNEKADEYAKAAAEEGEPNSAVPGEYRWETSLSHMARVDTEAQSRSTTQWAKDHVGPQRKYKPPRGRGQAWAPPAGAKVGCKSVLPVPVWARGDRPLPEGRNPQGGR